MAILMLALFASAAYGALYMWNPNKRPPVSLPEALRIAEKLLGDDAKNRYCISVVLYGNEKGDGKEGYWNLDYAADDGSKKHVYIDPNGEGSVELINRAIDWRKKPKRRTDLDDIASRLNRVLKDNDFTERATVKDGKLTLRAQSRTFRVYPKTETGAFGDELVEVIGPRDNGVVIEAHVTDHPNRARRGFSEMGTYWRTDRSSYLLAGEARFVHVHMQYGAGLPLPLLLRLMRAFGEAEPGFFG